jgi:lauroyl/myristoyl acyltransferase
VRVWLPKSRKERVTVKKRRQTSQRPTDASLLSRRDRLSRFMWQMGSWLATALPGCVPYRIADLAGVACFVLRARTRYAVEDNLAVVLGLPRRSPRVRGLACRVFVNFARAVVDFLMLGSSSDGWQSRVTLEGEEALWRERRRGRPVVLVSAHLGPWEVGAASLGVLGIPLAVVARPHRDRAAQEFFLQMRRRAGLEVLQPPGAGRRALTVLRRQGCVGMLADRGFGAGRVVRFFGKAARMPWGAVACALRTGASLVPGYTLREKNRWRVVIGRPLQLRQTGDWGRDLHQGMSRCLRIFEGVIRRHPEQWFVFEPLWGE